MKTLTLIVPCYNEEAVLPLFYEETSKIISGELSDYKVDLLFVDDGSKDKTLDIVKDLAMRYQNVKYISFSRNFGKEAAMLAGMENAVKSDYVGIMDADLQHSPDLIPLMMNYVENEGFDVAAAKREDRKGESKFKSFLSEGFYKVINKVSDTKISDSAQDFRVMKKDVVKSILAMSENIRFSKGIFSWVGFKVKWIPHENRERAAGETKWSLRKLMKYALDGILGFTNAPLRLGFVFSLLLALCTVGELAYALIRHIVNNLYVGTVPFILAGVFFVGAVITFNLGIMGEYLARTYTEVKGRPKYIIAQTNVNQNLLKYSEGEN